MINSIYNGKLKKIKFSIPSSKQRVFISSGEIYRSDTLNYQTLSNIDGGLFCDKVFGNSNNYICLCGNLINYSDKNLICPQCSIEVSSLKTRRYRMGHIRLNGLFLNTIFYKSFPYFLSIILNLSLKNIENILYNKYYLVLFPYKDLKNNTVLNYNNYIYYLKKYKNKFFANTGFEAISIAFDFIDLNYEFIKLRKFLLNNKNVLSTLYKKNIKRYKIISHLLTNNISLKNIFIDTLFVLPPDLRPMVKLPDSKLISSDLNELYKRVIVRANRYNDFLKLCSSDLILSNGKRLIQNSINDVFINNKIKDIFSDYNAEKRYKSITDNLKGKLGIFRQNLLGKRVDFSGRAVIVSAPHLNIDECSIPRTMAIELFRPFIYNKLHNIKKINIKAAKVEVDNKTKFSYYILNNIVRGNYVLLNRAPTLHKLGIQSFKIILNDNNVVKLHPLVCTAFNADFDGDQMAVHIPVTVKSKNEFKSILLSSNNVLLPSNGEVSIVPTQDIVLGIYYATNIIDQNLYNDKIFDTLRELELYYNSNNIGFNTKILFRFKSYNENKEKFKYDLKETTYGRLLIYNILYKFFDFSKINKVLRKEDLSDLLNDINYNYGSKEVVRISAKLMKLGFSFVTQSAISISIDDMLYYKDKNDIVEKSKLLTMYYNIDYLNGALSFKNKRNKILNIWELCSDLIFSFTIEQFLSCKKYNSFYKMIDSGARGSELQVRQICCMRGFMNYKGYTLLDIPVISSLREGLSSLEYFFFSHSSRKTLADTALKTSIAGYLTRRLVEIVSNTTITSFNCYTSEGILFKNLIYKGLVIEKFFDRILGRVNLEDIFYSDGSLLCKKDTLINKDIATNIINENINFLKLRSPVTCKSKIGVCSLCYGLDLSKNDIVAPGTFVGVVAAQSIGEPGTQLTMRTFHTGGAIENKNNPVKGFNSDFNYTNLTANNEGNVDFSFIKFVLNFKNEKIVISNFGKILIKDVLTNEVLETFNVPYASILLVNIGEKVNVKSILYKWISDSKLIVSDRSGYIQYDNLIENLNCVKRFDNINNKYTFNVFSNITNNAIFIKVCQDYERCDNFSKFKVYPDSVLYYNDNDYVNIGDILCRVYLDVENISDITGGLPKIISLFEARIPLKCALLSFYNGYIFFDQKKKYKYLIIKDQNKTELFRQRFNLKINFFVNEGDYVTKGDILIDGELNPHDILNIYGIEGLLNFYLSEVKSIYYSQGVKINDKHIEIIVKEMLSKVMIDEPGDSKYIIGDIVIKKNIDKKNKKLILNNKISIKYKNILSGITKTSLSSKSFLTAASFQETVSALSEAAIFGRIDNSDTIKNNIMLGKIIPAGTGFYNKIFEKKYKCQV